MVDIRRNLFTNNYFFFFAAPYYVRPGTPPIFSHSPCFTRLMPLRLLQYTTYAVCLCRRRRQTIPVAYFAGSSHAAHRSLRRFCNHHHASFATPGTPRLRHRRSTDVTVSLSPPFLLCKNPGTPPTIFILTFLLNLNLPIYSLHVLRSVAHFATKSINDLVA